MADDQKTDMHNIDIVMPKNTKLRESYLALLKELYVLQQDRFGFDELVNIVSLGCGVSLETAKDKIVQLARFKLLKYISTSVHQHTYVVLVFERRLEGNPIQLKDWDRYIELFERNFPDFAESDLAKIQRNSFDEYPSGLVDKVLPIDSIKTRSGNFRGVFDLPIITPASDDMISVFKTENKQSTLDLVTEIEETQRIKNSNDHSPT